MAINNYCPEFGSGEIVVFGTGRLEVDEAGTGAWEDVGNISLVDISREGESFTAFSGSSVNPMQLGITKAVRIRAQGDNHTFDNLRRMMNGYTIAGYGFDYFNFDWITEQRICGWRFIRDEEPDPNGQPALTLTLPRAYIEMEFTYGFSQDEIAYHTFQIVAMPNVTASTGTFGTLAVGT